MTDNNPPGPGPGTIGLVSYGPSLYGLGEILSVTPGPARDPEETAMTEIEVETGVDERSVWHALTRRERFRILPVVQDAWFAATHWTGIRDRMRCPSCKAVGTWKMHGSLLERWIYGDIHVRRWLCKWCGYYTGPRGRIVAYPDMAGSKAWALPEDGTPRQPTPAEVMREQMGKTWPWVG